MSLRAAERHGNLRGQAICKDCHAIARNDMVKVTNRSIRPNILPHGDNAE